MDASRAPDARSALPGGSLPPEGARERTPELANGERPERDSRFDGLHAEAKAAIGYSANSVRAIRERYREAYLEELARWQTLRDELERLERAGRPNRPVEAVDPASAAEAGADDARLRDLRREVALLTSSLGIHQQELTKLELAQQALERTWVFLERGDASLVGSPEGGVTPEDVRMQIVEAQEAERSRLAQEIHDGPAQALANAIFQVEYIDRVLGTDERLARTELHFLRELLRRELSDVRSFISQLRPPLLEARGLDAAIEEAADQFSALAGVPVERRLEAPAEGLTEAQQTVVLRVVQEALQNVRKHAAATRVTILTRVADATWTVEVHDDGRGFDVEAVAARGRRNFGLQFMRERAELIGAQLEIRSRPGTGTIISLAIPMGGGQDP
ncbi:MAG TPA: sensor histidine kinase [Candidatus Binatia bacterium]|nr:sensor histidine kinase [Candidatus Binatia bacterium]